MSLHLASSALAAAAVTGRFTLEKLAASVALPQDDTEGRAVVWREVSALAAEEPDAPEGYAWQLGPDARRTALRGIFSLPQLDLLMKTAPPAAAQAGQRDDFGIALQQILRRQRVAFSDPGRRAEPEELKSALRQLAAILDAVQFAEAVPALKDVPIPVRFHHDRPAAQLTLPQLKEMGEAKVKELQARHDIKVVLPDRHFGYTTERRKISRHVRGIAENDRPLLLTGVGGAGKSALLSRLMLGWGRSEPDMIVVLLDFDRRQLNSGEPIEIVTEMLRQIIAAFGLRGVSPDDPLLENLHQLRRDLALFKTTAGDGARETNAQQASDIRTVLRKARQGWAARLRETRIALILDTFEAVDRMAGYFRMVSHERGEKPPENAAVTQIMDMLGYIQRDILPKMRVVVSGREEPLTETELDQWFGTRLRLRGVSAISGAKILRMAAEDAGPAVVTRFADEDKARQVSTLLDGHPLALLAFIRYAADNTDDIDKLIADLETEGGFQAEFAQIFLYRRILNRISDDRIRKLAHPGLMLRRIDRDAISHILGWACLDRDPLGENPVTDAEADELFERLRNQYWLVQPDPAETGVVRHVPDLRRLMLGALWSGQAEEGRDPKDADEGTLRRRAEKVCDIAYHRYANSSDPLLRLDAQYYRAFVSPAPDALDLELAQRLELHLGDDVETLPTPWRARLKATLGAELSAPEAATLGAVEQEQARSRAFKRARQTGYTTKSGRPPPELQLDDFWDLEGADNAVPERISPDTNLSEFEEILKKEMRPRPPARSKPATPAELPMLSAPEAPRDQRVSVAELARQFEYLWGQGDLGSIFGAADQTDLLAEDLLWARFAAALLDQTPEEGDAVFSKDLETVPLDHPVYLLTLAQCALVAPRETRAPAADAEEAFHTAFGTLLHALRAGRSGRKGHVLRALRHYVGHFRFGSTVAANRAIARQLLKALDRPEAMEDASIEVDFFGLALAARPPQALLRDADSLPRVLGVVTDQLFQNARKSPPTLAELERVYRGADRYDLTGKDFEELSPEERTHFARMLRGLNPELLAPTASMLGTLDPATATELISGIAVDHPLWPVDLVFGEDFAFTASIAPTVVETTDRCGLLRDLLVGMSALIPDANRLITIHDLIGEIWFRPLPEN